MIGGGRGSKWIYGISSSFYLIGVLNVYLILFKSWIYNNLSLQTLKPLTP